MNQLLLIVAIAGEKVALRVEDIESVTELESLAPIPLSPPHVVGLSTLRSRVLTVIDCQCAVGLGQSGNRYAGTSAAIAVHDGHAYALLLDTVEDVTETRAGPVPSRAQLRGNWAQMSHGVVETDDGPRLLIDVAALIAGSPEVRAA